MITVSSYGGKLLRRGSTGNVVQQIQRTLNSLGYNCGAVDGIFGSKTEACVKRFQADQNLVADGIVGVFTWEKLFNELPASEPSAATLDAIRAIKSRTDIYHTPTPQDLEGNGIYPKTGSDGRSERVYPAYVLAPRRQVDSVVRQLLPLLPSQNTAFVLTERLVQNPEEYLPYLAGASKVVLVGSFVGIGTASSYPDWARERHNTELWRLERSLQLLKAMKRPVSSILYAMGDSSSPVATTIRSDLQKRLDQLLDQNSLSTLKQAVTWGADEAMQMALARTLPSLKVRIRISNPLAKHHYDGLRTSKEVITEKLTALGLTETDKDWDFEVAVLTRRPGGSIDDYQANDTQQAALDDAFLEPYRSYTPEQRSKLAIVDGRLFNGAWDNRSALPHTNLLAYGSWGTFGNVVGATLATAKLLFHAKNPAVQRQLYLEAIAHDVFANGYKEAQRGGLSAKLKAIGITFNHYNGYGDANTVAKVFEVLNQHVNTRMQQHFSGVQEVKDRTFQFTPQLWRTFESEVHLRPKLAGEVLIPGVYRKDLNPVTFSPLYGVGSVSSSLRFLQTDPSLRQIGDGMATVDAGRDRLQDLQTQDSPTRQKRGTKGDDVLQGTSDSDVLLGGAGNDTLVGKAGADVLVGGRGADVFVLGSEALQSTERQFRNRSVDTIKDFSIAQGDTLQIRHKHLSSVTDNAFKEAFSYRPFTGGLYQENILVAQLPPHLTFKVDRQITWKTVKP